MKKLLLFISVLTLGLTSCNKDDDSSSASLEGTWEYFQDGALVSGQEILMPYDHTAGCNKDYTVITSTTVIDHSFYMEGTPEACIEEIYTTAYTRNGNTLTVTDDGETFPAEIMQLDDTTLKIKFSYTYEGQTYADITVYKRMN